MGEEGGGADPNAAFDYSQLAAAIHADQSSPDAQLPGPAAGSATSDSDPDQAEGNVESDLEDDDMEGLLMSSGDTDSEVEAASGDESAEEGNDGSDAGKQMMLKAIH